MTHKDSICFKCTHLFDYNRMFRKDELVAICTKHFSRNAGNRKTCKDFELCKEDELQRRKTILKDGELNESESKS